LVIFRRGGLAGEPLSELTAVPATSRKTDINSDFRQQETDSVLATYRIALQQRAGSRDTIRCSGVAVTVVGTSVIKEKTLWFVNI